MCVTVGELVDRFYNCKKQDVGRSLYVVLLEMLEMPKDTSAKALVAKYMDQYPQIASMEKTLELWSATYYEYKKITRKSILNIAFVLRLSERQCNTLLQTANHLPLHYGGDASETIISYALKNQKSLEEATHLYNIYIRLIEIVSPPESVPVCNRQNPGYTFDKAQLFVKREISTKNNDADSLQTAEEKHFFTERTTYVKSAAHFTEMNKRTETISMAIKEGDEKRLNDALREFSIDSNDIEFLKRLWVFSNVFSSRSNKLFTYIKSLCKKYDIRSTDFFHYYGTLQTKEADNYQSIKNLFSYLNKNYKGEKAQSPSRTFFIFLCTIIWSRDKDTSWSLKEFVNIHLKECGYRLLNSKTPDDSFILELSRYRLGQNGIWYETAEGPLAVQVCDICSRNKSGIYREIIRRYIERKPSILKNCEFQVANQFFQMKVKKDDGQKKTIDYSV